LIGFQDGHKAFNHLQPEDLDDNFRSAVRKCILRMPEVALPTLACLFSIDYAYPKEIVGLIGELIPGASITRKNEIM
jgi:hypothetical protein